MTFNSAYGKIKVSEEFVSKTIQGTSGIAMFGSSGKIEYTINEGNGINISSNDISLDIQAYTVSSDISLATSATFGITGNIVKIAGATTMGSSLAVGGAVSFGDTLNVNGLVTYNSNLSSSYTDRSLVDNGWIKNLSSKGQILYVSPDGSDTRNLFSIKGSHSYPYQTITAAKNASSSGDVIMVLPGTYNENELGKANITYYFQKGAIVNYSGTSGVAIFNMSAPMNILGYGDFRNNTTAEINGVVPTSGLVFYLNSINSINTTSTIEFDYCASKAILNSNACMHNVRMSFNTIERTPLPVLANIQGFAVRSYTGSFQMRGNLINDLATNNTAPFVRFFQNPNLTNLTVDINTITSVSQGASLGIGDCISSVTFDIKIGKCHTLQQGISITGCVNLTSVYIDEIKSQNGVGLNAYNLGTTTRKEIITVNRITTTTHPAVIIYTNVENNFKLISKEIITTSNTAIDIQLGGTAGHNIEIDCPYIEGNSTEPTIRIFGTLTGGFTPTSYLKFNNNMTRIKNSVGIGIRNTITDYRNKHELYFYGDVIFDTVGGSIGRANLNRCHSILNIYNKLFIKEALPTPVIGTTSIPIVNTTLSVGSTAGFDFITNNDTTGTHGTAYYNATIYPITYVIQTGDTQKEVAEGLVLSFNASGFLYGTAVLGTDEKSVSITFSDGNIDFTFQNPSFVVTATTPSASSRVGRFINKLNGDIIINPDIIS